MFSEMDGVVPLTGITSSTACQWSLSIYGGTMEPYKRIPFLLISALESGPNLFQSLAEMVNFQDPAEVAQNFCACCMLCRLSQEHEA
jgi:hypothetical protein